MTENKQSREIKTGGASYVGWRGELLAQLALRRLPEVSVHVPKEECGYDFLVAAPSGVCFFVITEAFSSKKLDIPNVEQITESRWRVDAERVVRAQESHTPVFVFLIDADTDHGRYLRLDTIDGRNESSRGHTIRFTLENTIDKAGIEKLVAELEKSERALSH